jgi:hypothetical protein
VAAEYGAFYIGQHRVVESVNTREDGFFTLDFFDKVGTELFFYTLGLVAGGLQPTKGMDVADIFHMAPMNSRSGGLVLENPQHAQTVSQEGDICFFSACSCSMRRKSRSTATPAFTSKPIKRIIQLSCSHTMSTIRVPIEP